MIRWFKRLFCPHTWYEVPFFDVATTPPWKQPSAWLGERAWMCLRCGKHKITNHLDIPISYVGN